MCLSYLSLKVAILGAVTTDSGSLFHGSMHLIENQLPLWFGLASFKHCPSYSYADLPQYQIITKNLHLYEEAMEQSALYIDQICTMEVAERKTECKVQYIHVSQC